MRKPVRWWLLVVGMLSFVGVGVVVLVVVDAATDDSDGGLLAVLDVPSLGDTESAFLRDGHPVFVVHDLDGTVIVIEAVSTHLPDDRMAWCPSSRTIDDVPHGARWDAQGRYVSGPGPRDLGRYEIEVIEGQEELEVVAYVEPPPRSQSPDGRAGPLCVDGGYEVHPYYDAS